MKKVYRILCLLLVCSLLGCSSVKKEAEDKLLSSNDVDAEKIILQGTGVAEVEYYPENSINKEAESVVLGKVVDVNYQVLDGGNIITVETINVEETIAGNTIEGDQIVVWKSGGVATLDMFINSFAEEDREAIRGRVSTLSDEELTDHFVEAYTKTDIQSKTDMRFILYLKKTDLDTADYRIVYDNYGEYLELDDGTFFSSGAGLTLDEYYYYTSDEKLKESLIELKGVIFDKEELYSQITSGFGR